MMSILHVVPKAFRLCTYDGTYKDIIGRVRFFESSGADYRQVAVTGDDPSELDECLRDFTPTNVLVEYTYFRNIVKSLRERLPEALIAARAHNIEPLQHFENHGLFPKRGPAWLIYGMLRLFISDFRVRRTADAIFPISDWEARAYWWRLPGRSAVKWLPYFAPDFVLGKPGKVRKQEIIACLPGRADHTRNRDMVECFIKFCEVAAKLNPALRFIITGDLTNSGIKVPRYIELPGLVDDIAEFLAPVKAVAVLSPLGYGFKTTIADALANGCYALVHPIHYEHGPAEIKEGCVPVGSVTPGAVAEVIERISEPLEDSSVNDRLRERAFDVLTRDFLSRELVRERAQRPRRSAKHLSIARPRELFANVMVRSGLWKVWRPEAFVLLYHGVTESVREPWLETGLLPLATFRKHLDFLQKHRVVVPLAEVFDCLTLNKPPDPRWVAIVFDDALSVVKDYAIPELYSRGMPFTIGVPAALPGSGRSLWEFEAAFLVHRLHRQRTLGKLMSMIRDPDVMGKTDAEVQAVMDSERRGLRWVRGSAGKAAATSAALKQLLRESPCCDRLNVLDRLKDALEPDLSAIIDADGRFSVMDWDDLRGACSSGGAIAAHGYFHHPHNSWLEDSCRLDELRSSRQTINDRLGTETDCFVWPEGVSDTTSIEVGTRLGYKYFVSTRAARITRGTPCTDIPRLSGQWSLEQMQWLATHHY
ncbi:MAG: polysaccharide deacetylase family protein [Blastocatellia bacterium]